LRLGTSGFVMRLIENHHEAVEKALTDPRYPHISPFTGGEALSRVS